MSVLEQLYEAWTSDARDDLRASLDADAAAKECPFVHGVGNRGDRRTVVHFWCADAPCGSELRVDFATRADALLWRGGHVRADEAAVSALIVGAFFEAHCDGWYRSKGVRSLRFRSLRDGAFFVVDHERRFDEARDLAPLLVRADPAVVRAAWASETDPASMLFALSASDPAKHEAACDALIGAMSFFEPLRRAAEAMAGARPGMNYNGPDPFRFSWLAQRVRGALAAREPGDRASTAVRLCAAIRSVVPDPSALPATLSAIERATIR